MYYSVMIDKLGFLDLKQEQEDKFQIEFNQKPEWVQNLLVNAAPDEGVCGHNPTEWAAESILHAKLDVERLCSGDKYFIKGKITAKLPSLCAGSGEAFQSSRDIDVNALFEDQQPGDEDDQIWPLMGQKIDLGHFVQEQLLLHEPLAEYSPETLKNSACTLKVPQNSEIITGQPAPKEANLPFSGLNKLIEEII